MKNGRKGMNKLLTALLCAAVTTVFSIPSFADTDTDVPEEETKVVAKIADAEYSTLAEAVSAAKGGDVIKMQADTAENITIPEAKRLTLDLGTATITNAGGHTITNHGTLTIKGSGTVTNTVDNKGTLVNDGTVIFKGGTLTRSDDEGNTWYIIHNKGDLTVAGGHVIQPENVSSAVYNVEKCNSTLTFESGSVEAGRIAVKNETTAVINGGTFTAQETVLNWGDIEIHGGTFNGYIGTWGYDENPAVPKTLIDGENVVINAQDGVANNLAIGATAYGQIQEEKNWPTVQVKNANVNGTVQVGSYDTNTHKTDFDTKYQNTQAVITVSGGNYTEKMDDVFLAENKVLIGYKGTGGYKYTVHQHDWNTEPTVDKEATCTEEGSQSIHCKSCDATKDAEVIAKTDHTWGEWKETTAPTCTEEGSKERSCTVCGTKEMAAVDATGHDWNTEPTVDKKATCVEEGSQSIPCKNCDATKDTEVIAKTDHTWDDGQITTEPTCTKDGVRKYICTVCGGEKKEVVDAAGHDWNTELTVDKKATCTEDGSQSIHCKNCDATKDAEIIKATGHTFTHKIEKAGALKNGSEYDICSNCQLKKNVKKLTGYAEYVVKGYKVGQGKKAFTAKWTKASAANQKKMDGYQVRYSLKSSMAGAKMKTAAKTSKSKKISQLKSKKKYYVQVRTYKKSNGVTYYSKWSGKKTVKTR